MHGCTVAELLGVPPHRFFLPQRRIRLPQGSWRAGPRIQGHGERPARGRHRGRPRRRLQPHRRGERARAAPTRSAASTTRSTTCSTPTAVPELHRLRQHDQLQPPRRPRPDPRLSCATGSPTCTSTASASTWRPSWAAAATAACWRSRRSSSTSPRTPLLAETKLIAEPWDAAGLYQVGNFPPAGRWAEWNGRFRDDVRRFVRAIRAWRGPGHRLCGSPDLYSERRGARSTRSTSSPATTASRFGTWSATTASTTRPTARTTATAGTTTELELRHRGADARCGCPRPAAAADAELCDAAVLAGRPDAAGGDEFGRTQRATTTPSARTTTISWVDWRLREKQRRPVPVFQASHPVSAGASVAPP